MNFISLLPLAVSAAGGGAAPATGFVSVAGAGISETESVLNRLTSQLRRAVFEMSKNSGENSKKNTIPDFTDPAELSSLLRAPVVTDGDVLEEAREMVLFLGEVGTKRSIQEALNQAHQLSGLSLNKVGGIYYRKPHTSVKAAEFEQLKRRKAIELHRRIQRKEAELANLRRMEGLVRESA